MATSPFLINRFILILICLFCGSPAFAQHLLSIEHSVKPNQAEKVIQLQIIESGVVEQVSKLINSQLLLKYPLGIVFGDTDGPLYDDETKNIYIPYDFIGETNQRFENVDAINLAVQAKTASIDALAHTLLHELGHALIPMFAIPY